MTFSAMSTQMAGIVFSLSLLTVDDEVNSSPSKILVP